MREFPAAVRWALRVVAAVAAATLTTIGTLRMVDGLTLEYPSVQTDAVRAIHDALEDASTSRRERLNVVFFGDSLAMSDNFAFPALGTPRYLRKHLLTILTKANPWTGQSVRVLPILYSGLSQYSLYYIADSIVELRPDLAVVEFNLYNFSAFWEHRDRKILTAMLDLSRFPEFLALPATTARQSADQWIFDKLLLRGGWLSAWSLVQREQARCGEGLWVLADRAQGVVGSAMLSVRWQNRNLDLQDTIVPGNRSTAPFSRTVFGQALTGIEEGHAALRMLAVALERFRSAGIRTTVYVPPYNLDHLNSIGVLEGAHLEETIAHVRAVAERSGATFLDLHALLTDDKFRDGVDHLSQAKGADGHDKIAERIADVLAEDSKRIVADYH